MSRSEETLCFTCGLPLGDPPRLNHLPSGQVCPHCADRLLETLPPLLPSFHGPFALGPSASEPSAEGTSDEPASDDELEVPVFVRGPRRTIGEERELPPGA